MLHFGRVTPVSFLTVLLLQVVAFGISVIITPLRGVAWPALETPDVGNTTGRYGFESRCGQ